MFWFSPELSWLCCGCKCEALNLHEGREQVFLGVQFRFNERGRDEKKLGKATMVTF